MRDRVVSLDLRLIYIQGVPFQDLDHRAAGPYLPCTGLLPASEYLKLGSSTRRDGVSKTKSKKVCRVRISHKPLDSCKYTKLERCSGLDRAFKSLTPLYKSFVALGSTSSVTTRPLKEASN